MLAVVWHYWIGFLLAVGVVLLLLSLVGGYVSQVQMRKYPKKR